MLVIELLLGAACLALIATNVRDKKLIRQNRLLSSQNDRMGQYLLEEGDEERHRAKTRPHRWSPPHSDVVYKSKSPVSYDRVVMSISVCADCQLVHRYLVEGHTLAQKKGLTYLEGFYLGGVKTVDRGCFIESTAEIVLEEDFVQE